MVCGIGPYGSGTIEKVLVSYVYPLGKDGCVLLEKPLTAPPTGVTRTGSKHHETTRRDGVNHLHCVRSDRGTRISP